MFKYFLKREIKENYLGNLTGFSWVIIQPVLILIIYTVVFEKIFKARIPEAENVGFIVYLALAFWPWIAFSESILKSITTITSKKDLVGKVKVDLRQIVFATVTSVFIINLIGYVFVLLILMIIGKSYNYTNIPLLILPILQLYVLSLSLAMILSSLQVFVRDTMHLMGSLITLWFFSTPIIYSESIMPDVIRTYMQYNPLYYPVKFIHNAMLTEKNLPWAEMIILSIVIGILFYMANKMFNKLSPHFEDFL